MKKNILFIVLLVISANVYAKTEYTEYNLVGYTAQKKEDSELVKYVKTKLNRFYQHKEINILYLEEGIKIESSPYIDENDYIIETYYGKYRQFIYPNIHTYLLKAYNNYKTKEILIENFNTGYATNPIHEIEIYANEKKLDYNINKLKWLNDGKIDNGKYLKGTSLTITLDDYYPINELEVYIHYDYNQGYPSSLEIEYKTSDEAPIRETIELEAYLEKGKKTLIKTTSPEKFETLLPKYSLMTFDEVIDATKCSYFTYNKTLYKHYDLIKEYYITADLTFLEGYTYDEDESIPAYRIMQREKIEIIEPEETLKFEEGNTPNIESTEEELILVDKKYEDNLIIPETDENKSITSDKTMTNLSKKDVKNVSKYPAVMDTTKDRNSEPIKVVNIEKKEDKKAEKPICVVNNNFLLRYIIVITIMYIFTMIIRFIRVKYRNKNDL